ncbi:quinon protein alcohol dehydrogenase-like superfamily [Cladochytrium replicatum]|nr:quinon protein alcohol dehydrogenase-like superfamily [Cladochytrium replicatum]
MSAISADDLLYVGVLGFVHALRKSSGTLVWSKTLDKTGFNPTVIQPHPPTTSLIVSSGANLRCLSASNGEQLWENPLIGFGMGYSTVALEPPAHPAPAPPVQPESNLARLADYMFVGCNRTVRALRLSDGVDLWQFDTPMSGSCSTLPALLVEDGVLFVSGNRNVWGLDAFKGQQLWQTTLPDGDSYHTLATMRSGPLSRPQRFDPSSVAGYETTKSALQSILFVGASGFVTRIEREQGFPAPLDDKSAHITIKGVGFPEVQAIPLPSSSTAIVAAGVNVRRISLKNNEVLWENQLKGMGFGVVTILVGGGIVSNSQAESEELPAYADGTEAEYGESSSSSPVAWNDRVFVAINGKIRAISISSGAMLWEYKPAFFKRIIRPAHLLADFGGRIYVAGSGNVHCVDAENGNQIWVSKEPYKMFATISSYGTGNGETNRSNAFLPVLKRTRDDDDRHKAGGGT